MTTDMTTDMDKKLDEIRQLLFDVQTKHQHDTRYAYELIKKADGLMQNVKDEYTHQLRRLRRQAALARGNKIRHALSIVRAEAYRIYQTLDCEYNGLDGAVEVVADQFEANCESNQRRGYLTSANEAREAQMLLIEQGLFNKAVKEGIAKVKTFQ